jgi:hypothetical protein
LPESSKDQRKGAGRVAAQLGRYQGAGEEREDDLSKAGVTMLENVDGKSMVGQMSPQFLEFVLDAYRSLKYGK